MFSDITEEEIEQLSTVAEQIETEERLSKAQEEMEILKVRMEIEGVNLTAEIEIAEKITLELKQKHEEIINTIGDARHPLIAVRKRIFVAKEKLAKLNAMKEKVKENIFLKLEKQYSTEVVNLEKEAKEHVDHLQQLKSKAQNFLQKSTEILEELNVRKELGDISEEDLQKKLDAVKIKEGKTRIILKGVKFLLSYDPKKSKLVNSK